VLKHVEYQTPELTAALARYGYGLGNLKGREIPPAARRYGVEELVIRILTSNPDPRYVEGLPVIMAKNTIDYAKLLGIAENGNALKRLGWMLSMAKRSYKDLDVPYDLDLEATVEKCKSAKGGLEEVFNPNFDIAPYRERAKRVREPISAEWGIMTLHTLEAFERNLILYGVQQRKTA